MIVRRIGTGILIDMENDIIVSQRDGSAAEADENTTIINGSWLCGKLGKKRHKELQEDFVDKGEEK